MVQVLRGICDGDLLLDSSSWASEEWQGRSKNREAGSSKLLESGRCIKIIYVTTIRVIKGGC